MKQIILITGSTDGIGLAAAEMLAQQGHTILLHGRSAEKLKRAEEQLAAAGATVESYIADLSNLSEVEKLAAQISENHQQLDVLINNAGVLKMPDTSTPYGIDARFVVNTIAPYLLTQRLLPLIPKAGRVINLSSAAQAPVQLSALKGEIELDDMGAYAQSKLAIVMWNNHLARTLPAGPVFISVNPGSLLATKIVKEGFGMAGNDLSIGAEILFRLATADEFADASGQYFDNDSGQLSSPHPDGLNLELSQQVTETIEELINRFS